MTISAMLKPPTTSVVGRQHLRHGMMYFLGCHRGCHVTMLVLVLIFSLMTHTTAQSLCQSRCESGTPNLLPLKIVWRRTMQRMDTQGVTFEEFVASLVQASEHRSRSQLRGQLLQIINQYRDCLTTCEFHHSKRSENGGRQSLYIVRLPGISTKDERRRLTHRV